MKMTLDISLYPLADEYLPAIVEFIERIQRDPGVAVVRTDLSTQLFGDYDDVMDLLKVKFELAGKNMAKVYSSSSF